MSSVYQVSSESLSLRSAVQVSPWVRAVFLRCVSGTGDPSCHPQVLWRNLPHSEADTGVFQSDPDLNCTLCLILTDRWTRTAGFLGTVLCLQSRLSPGRWGSLGRPPQSWVGEEDLVGQCRHQDDRVCPYSGILCVADVSRWDV